MEAEHEPDTRLEEELTEEELEAEQLSELIEAFETGKPGEVLENLDAYHPADAADLLEQLPRSVLSETAELLGEQFPTEILLELRDEYREIVVDNLPDAAISEAVNSLDSDDAALILEDLAEDDGGRHTAEVHRGPRPVENDGADRASVDAVVCEFV